MTRRARPKYNLRRWLTVVCCSAALAACDNDPIIVYVDPAIDLGDYSAELIVEGPPTVKVGFYIEQLFSPLEDGGECFVAYGVQGGTWTMPALRTTGIGSPVSVACQLVTESGELVGDVAAEIPLFLTPDGFLEIQAFPIPVRHAPPNEDTPIEDLYGAPATLTCSVSDFEERADQISVLVEIVED